MPSKPHRGPEDPADTFDVYISFAGPSGRKYALALRDALAAQGRRAFVDEFNFALGNGLERIIDAAMGAAKGAVVVVSIETPASPFQQAEVQSALRYSRERGSDFVVIPWCIAGGPSPVLWPVGLRSFRGHDSAGLAPKPAAAELASWFAEWFHRNNRLPASRPPAAPLPPAPPLPTQSPPHFPPAWAVEWGHDEHGPYASFAVERVIQRMRWCPPGRFWMGSPAFEPGRSRDEGPQFEVTLNRGFWLSDTPVTQALYTARTGRNPSEFRGPARQLHPVENVSWNDAVELSAQLQRSLLDVVGANDGLVVRLPTEAEWEYACRAGTTGATYAPAVKRLTDIAWVEQNASGSTQPVAKLLPNAWGLFDMLGNVWEWCADACDWEPPYPIGARIDPVGLVGPGRAHRGGSFIRGGDTPRAAKRYAYPPEYRSYALGLRLCIGPPLPNRA